MGKEEVIVRIQELQVMAGVASSLLFAFSTLPMLLKAYRTKDLKSYSLGNLTISNIGNLVHWVYVSGLPFGPIWFLHGFYTTVTAMMLFWYLRYEEYGVFAVLGKRLRQLWGNVDRQSRRFFRPAQVRVRQVCTCTAPCACPTPCPYT